MRHPMGPSNFGAINPIGKVPTVRFDDGRMHAQAEQICQPLLLRTRHHRFDTPRHITAQQSRPTAAPQAMQQRP